MLQRASSEHGGTYYCVADNTANHPVPSNTATINVSLARWKKVLIGASCILLVVILIGVGCYLYRAKRGATPHFDSAEWRAANGMRDSVASLPTSNRSSYNSPATGSLPNIHFLHVYVPVYSADVRGRSVWSEKESDSDSNDQSCGESQKEPDVQYTEVVHPQAADGIQAPVKKGTDTVYSELQNSPQGVADQSGYQGSVEYAQLNHDLPQPV
ncbi:hypothetical protein GJAV_G00145600 [Gymnothorax javanicus]|nr:hypothetical protein GJAV_G00145600 [Gymnothorax javanicus]